jgi:hypothetical protein
MDRKILWGPKRKRKAQATVELSIALIMAMMLLVGAAKIMVWLSGRVVARQKVYEETRVSAGSQTISNRSRLVEADSLSVAPVMDETRYPALNIIQ